MLLLWFLFALILPSICLFVPYPLFHLSLSVLYPSCCSAFPSHSFSYPTSLRLRLFIPLSPSWNPDLKIVLTIFPTQDGAGRNSLEPEWVSLLPVCDLKPHIVLKLIHPLFTAFYNLQITVTVNIRLNNQLTWPSRSRFVPSRLSSIIEKGIWKDCHAWLLIKSHGRHMHCHMLATAVWVSTLMRCRMCLSNVFTPREVCEGSYQVNEKLPPR